MRGPTLTAILFLLAAGPAWGGQDVADRAGFVSLRSDNDSYNPSGHTTDRWYTNGIRLDWMNGSRTSAAGRFWPAVRDAVCGLACGRGWQNGVLNQGWTLGQNMYTPNRIMVAAAQPNDRPWAGWLYYGRIVQQTYIDGSLGLLRQDRFEIDLGMVGPWSLAGDTQLAWHHLWGFDRPAGWANQLRNEPGLIVRYDTRVSVLPRNGWVSLIPYAGISLGNIYTAAALGTVLNIGYHVDELGAAAGPGGPTVTADTEWALYVFGRIEGRAVARNIFLDGNSFRTSPHVDKEPLVYDLTGGVAASFPFGLTLTYEYVRRSKEFNVPRRLNPTQDFGSIRLGWRLAID